MSRSKAFAIHFGLTLVALIAVFTIVRELWYPHPLFVADGAWPAFWLLAGVTLTLGPLLTLFTFRPGKKGLPFDLAVIGVLQLAGFVFCVHLLYARRVQMVVYSQGSFYGLDALRMARIGPHGRLLLKNSRQKPAYVYVHLPHSKKAMLGVEIRTLRGEPPIFLRGWRYRPYTAREQGVVLTHGFPLATIAQTNPVAARVLAGFRTQHPHLNRYVFVPFHGTYASVVLALHRANGRLAEVLAFNPGVLGTP